MLDRPGNDEWFAAAERLHGWIRSGFDVMGRCLVCGGRKGHVRDCPWPAMGTLLGREAAVRLREAKRDAAQQPSRKLPVVYRESQE